VVAKANYVEAKATQTSIESNDLAKNHKICIRGSAKAQKLFKLMPNNKFQTLTILF
jgi:hypothetical protein